MKNKKIELIDIKLEQLKAEQEALKKKKKEMQKKDKADELKVRKNSYISIGKELEKCLNLNLANPDDLNKLRTLLMEKEILVEK